MASRPAGAVERTTAYWRAGGQTLGGQTEWKRSIAEAIAEGGLTLDVGCGAGDSSPPGAIGLDAATSALRTAAGRGVVPVAADAEAPWPIRTGCVDAVLLFDVVEHVPDPRVLLAEAWRCLREGGLLLLAVPNAAHAANRLASVRGQTSDFTDAAHHRRDPVSDHLHRFSADGAAQLLVGAGFTVQDRHDWFPDRFTERLQSLSFVARALRASGAVRRWPGLFAYEFLYVARKGAARPLPRYPDPSTNGHKPASALPSPPAATRWSEADPRFRGYLPTQRGVRLDHRIRSALALLPKTSGGTLVDLGSGDGYVTAEAADRCGARTAVGIDEGFPPQLAPARRPITRVRAGLGSALPFRTGSVDVVLCLEAIEHVPDPDFVFTEIRRVLAPGGALVLSTPRLDSLLIMAALSLGLQPPGIDASVRRRYGNPLGEGRPSGHRHLFTARALREALQANGFRIEARRHGRFSSSWRQARRSSRRFRPRDVLLEAGFALYDVIPVRKDVLIVRAVVEQTA